MILLYMLLLHFIADFLLQSREMGKKKSKELKWLALHVGIQFLVFIFGLWPFVGPDQALDMAIFIAIVHGVIDITIWNVAEYIVLENYRRNHHLRRSLGDAKNLLRESGYEYWEKSWFYSVIGLDQALHFATLTILFLHMKGIL